jgi:hypothetical protein
VTFSENVNGVDITDFSLTTAGTATGTIASVSAATGTIIDVTVNAVSGNGTIRLDLKTSGTGITDNAGNSIAGGYSSGQTYTIDKMAPTVFISSTVNDPTNVNPVPITITFSEPVTGFAVGDITVTNGTAGNFSGSGTTYTADITPASQGIVSVDIAGSVAQDAAGNNNTAATQIIGTFDNVSPTIDISTSVTFPTKISPIPISISFSESVTGFVAGDITVTNGTVGNFIGSGTTYSVDIIPSGQGTVSIDIAGSVAQDAAGNYNIAATQVSGTFDNVAPTIAISSSASSPTKLSPIPLTITFSESVTGFVIGDITVTNGTAGNFSGSGTTYTANITPSGQGAVNVNIAGSVAIDAAGNNNTAATQFSMTYDTQGPTVTISSVSVSPTKISPIPVTVIFSEPVTGFVVGDITVTNGTAGNFSGSGTTYTADITPASQGIVSVDISGSVAQDAAGNNNTAATQLSRTFDNISPTVTISSTASEPTKNSPVPITITFSESVIGFVVGDITLTNGTATGFSGSGPTYTVNITPSGQGAVSIAIVAGVATDDAGNINSAATTLTRTYDSQSPAVSITSSAGEPTKTSPIPVTITFNEPVTGFVVGDITVTNGTAGAFSGSGDSYSVNVTPSGQGTVTVAISAGVAIDAAGNGNMAATSLTRTYDNQSPTVTISSTATNPTNASPIPVTVTFSESVTGFVVGDITVTNGTTSDFSGNGDSYAFNVTPSGQGTVTVNVAAGVALDAAGNGNIIATGLSRTYDSQSPTVTISSTASDPTKVSPIPVSIVFSEIVGNIFESDISVTNGTVGNVSGSGTSYTAEITPSGQGIVTVNVAAGVTADAAGNGNYAATALSRTYDSQGPTATLTTSASEPTNASPIVVTVTFSETVTNFASGDVTVTNGSVGNLTGSGTTYTVDITPAGQGVVSVNLAAGMVTDAAGNGNTPATEISRTFDNVVPTVTLTTTATEPTGATSIPVTITFSEPVTGFDVADITVTNANLGALSGSETTYTINITPLAQGIVTVNVSAGVAQDAAGNDNTAATQLSRTYNNPSPTVIIASTAGNPTNIFPIPVTVTFSAGVTGFVVGDITINNGTASDFSGSGTTYTFNVNPSGQGVVTVDIASGVATDGDGNGNIAAPTFTRTYDSQSPTVNISSTTGNLTNASPIPVTITFNETVTGFDEGDITVANGTIVGFGGNGTTYTADITPSGQGTVTVDIAAGIAQDAAGNGNTIATQFTRTYDETAPSVAVTSIIPDPTNLKPIPLRIVFSEEVTGFTLSDIKVGNCTATNLQTTDNITWTADISANGNGAFSVEIYAGVAQDLAGNGNTASPYFQRTYDPNHPTVTLSSTSTDPTNNNPIVVRISFSETVWHFDLNDIVVINGTASNLQMLDYYQNWTVDISPATNGDVTVDIPAGVAEDYAANTNTAAAQFSRTVDITSPGVTITSGSTNPTNVSPIAVTITFSEEVTGFDLSDITVGNGTASNLQTSDNTVWTLEILPAANGAVTLDVAAGVAKDLSGLNDNTAAIQWNRNYTSDIILFGNAGLAGTTLNYTDGTPKTVTADSNGEYSIIVPAGWNGTVTPSKPGFAFNPANKSYSNVLSNQIAQDYTATAITYTISGNAGVVDATLSYTDGSAKTATTDANGNYSFTVPYNWSGTVSVSKTGYVFSSDLVYINVMSDLTGQDYTATAITYAISGNVGVAEATLSYTDGSAKTATTDTNGNYSFTVPYNWSGTVSVSKTGYVFSSDLVYINVMSDLTGQDYTATAITYTISGNVGVAEATLSYTDGSAKTVVADAGGNYSITVSYDWSGTVTPSKTNYNFEPVNKTYSNVLGDQTTQNYTATITGICWINTKPAQVIIYPTLVYESFKVEVIYPKNGTVTVKILNLSGIAVKEFKFTKSSGEEIFPVAIGSLITGQYMVEVSINGYRHIERIIISQ